MRRRVASAVPTIRARETISCALVSALEIAVPTSSVNAASLASTLRGSRYVACRGDHDAPQVVVDPDGGAHCGTDRRGRPGGGYRAGAVAVMVKAGRLTGLEHQDAHLVPLDRCSGADGAGDLAPIGTPGADDGRLAVRVVPAQQRRLASPSAAQPPRPPPQTPPLAGRLGPPGWRSAVALPAPGPALPPPRARCRARSARTLTTPAVTAEISTIFAVLRILECQRENGGKNRKSKTSADKAAVISAGTKPPLRRNRQYREYV